jgi:hypothetical protein
LAAAKKGTEIAEIRLLAENGKFLAGVNRTGNVLSQRTDDGQIVLRTPERIAVVAVARRLSGILYAMWRDGKEYRAPNARAEGQAVAA